MCTNFYSPTLQELSSRAAGEGKGERFQLSDALVWDVYRDGDLESDRIGQALMILRSKVEMGWGDE